MNAATAPAAVPTDAELRARLAWWRAARSRVGAWEWPAYDQCVQNLQNELNERENEAAL